MIVVGITGNFSSGKSAVSAVFKKLGAKVFDADVQARKVTRKGTAVYRAIVQIFGKEYLDEKGEIDRRLLGERVFSSPKDLKKLKILIHPEVILEAMKMIKALKNKEGILVLDVPLLFESRMERLADVVLVVAATKLAMTAHASKKGVSAGMTKKILSTQWPLSTKVKRADYVIENDGNLKTLEKKSREIFYQIKKEKGLRDQFLGRLKQAIQQV